MAPQGGGNIKVVVRVRPFNSRENDRGAKCIVEMRDNQTVLTPSADVDRAGKGAKDSGQKVFAFDKSYWSFNHEDASYAGQSSLFDDLGRPLLDNAFQGYNNCIFAYGQTGSGKSYSMMGYGKEVGIIPNICQDMFQRIGELHEDKTLRCTVEVSYLEIYNERVRDLLNPSTKGNLKVREHPSTGPYVEDLAKLAVTSFQEIENLMDEGNKARTVAATNMNETSSRSHAVFTLVLTQKKHDTETRMEMEKAAKISLVDLAGSERATSTGATGARLKEGAEINRSLSTLGRVIAALADISTGKKKKGASNSQVPYRDSVLTWLLKDSLGGNSMTAMIAAISPADINYDETLSTLRYADSAKRIKNHAVINEDANARMIRELKEELALLKSKLGGGGGGGGGAGGSGSGDADTGGEGTPLEQQFVTISGNDGAPIKVSKAEIAEQMNQTEKILKDLNQTWEQKLAKTEEIHKEREAALEELGISIEKGFIGLSTPKKMPHIVNLSDDPLLAECLVYNLKPGTTTVGNVDTNADHQANIRLNGTGILHDHCVFENAPDGTVTLVPREGASVMVNGKRTVESKQLHSGYRLILGGFHIFRFNHPMEARAERADRSLLRQPRQSVTASQLAAFDRGSNSPSPGPRSGHERTVSKPASEWGESRPSSPANRARDDWSMARREAAGAILGNDQNLSSLRDDELNALFEDVQRARAERVNNGRELDEDAESVTSYPFREKYMSTGTIDNISLDTALTMPSTPKHGEVEDKLRETGEAGEAREEVQPQVQLELELELERRKEEFQEQLKLVQLDEVRREKARMGEALQAIKEEMQQQLEVQRRRYEEKLDQLDPLKRPRPKGNDKLSEVQLALAKGVIRHWKSKRYVRMAETVLQHAATLKEAQVMSNELDAQVTFQFTVVDVGHVLCSSYDMVLNGLTGEGDDVALEESSKPCVGIRVVDFKHHVVHLWSMEKLHDRVRQMRQMHQYLDQPEYAQHPSLDNPFVETCMPQYTLVGEVDVPLKAVLESRVQDFTLDVLSPYTSHVIGMIKLSLEPSHATAPPNTLKFNVVMHEMVGFAEREGTEVHAQLFIPGGSEEDGIITTTQMMRGFDEGAIRFESVHSMSLPLLAPRTVALRAAIFAKVSTMHLDKLLSWDDMRDAVPSSQNKPKAARMAETHFFTKEKHDLLARVQVLELDENGRYMPVDVTQTGELDTGTFQLHQGLQRRIAINVSHSAGDVLPWEDIISVRVGRIQLVDQAAKTPGMAMDSPSPDVKLCLPSKPMFRENANGTRSVTMTAQWDSSLHNSLLLDRTTADRCKVQMVISWEISSSKLAEPMRFSQTVSCRVLSRNFARQTSMFSSLLFQSVRIVQSSGCIFTLTLRPAPIKVAGDLWRMSSQHGYVKGEEQLTNWTPRGVSLIGDYLVARKKKRMGVEISSVRDLLRKAAGPRGQEDMAAAAMDDDDLVPPRPVPISDDDDDDDDLLADAHETPRAALFDESQASDTQGPWEVPPGPHLGYAPEQTALLQKCLGLWTKYSDPLASILGPENTLPPVDGAPTTATTASPEAASPPPAPTPTLISTIIRVPKNPSVLKGGYLLVPSNDSTRWVKRFVELRRPFLHVHSANNGEEVAIVSLRNARVDSQPGILALLQGGPADDVDGNSGGPNLQPRHRRTISGRIITSLWTDESQNGGAPDASNGSFHDSAAASGGHKIQRLSERLQAAVFAIYGTDNTWLFAARSERDKMDWTVRIDRSFVPAPSNVA